MSIFDSFPLMNAYSVNLDWILKKIRDLEEYVRNYTAVNNVAYAGVWDITKQYTQWAIVTDGDTSYLAMQPVPAGVPLENSEYWQKLADLDPRISGIIAQLTEIEKYLNLDWVTPQKFGAKGDGVSDDTAAFQAAIDYCIDNNKVLRIPATGPWNQEGGYILSRTININHPMAIISDPNALLNWKNAHENTDNTITIGPHNSKRFASRYGINIDYGNYRGHKGYYSFGVLQGDKSFYYPGGTEPSGKYWTGVRIANGDLVNFNAQYISYWGTGIVFASDVDYCGNCRINFLVMDDCETGIVFSSGNHAIQNLELYFNTIGICKRGLVFDCNSTIDNIKISGIEIFVEYPDGFCVYNNKDIQPVNVYIEVLHCMNHNTEVTKIKTGSESSWVGTIIDGINNGFNASQCTIKLGVYNGNMGSGEPLRFIVRGSDNEIENTWRPAQGSFGYPVTLVTSGLETDFNGGLGGAIFADGFFSKWSTDREYKRGESVTLYGFMECLTAGYETPMMSLPLVCADKTVNTIISDTYESARRFKMTVTFISDTPKGYELKWFVKIIR